MELCVHLEQATIQDFQKTAYSHYSPMRDGQIMPWRADPSPYNVFVSEFMLQQTQVSRVIDAFLQFIAVFPDIRALAEADFRTVLTQWQGLGYNRRAKYLHQSAKQILAHHGGRIPPRVEDLKRLDGIGPYTAGAICAFAFSQPVLFIDTNIRRVYIHYFFSNREHEIDDVELEVLNEQCLDRDDPRKWYGALMDWGALLGRQMKQNPNKKSRHYAKQSPFAGSVRQVRGQILRLLVEHRSLSYEQLQQQSGKDNGKFSTILYSLQEEGFVMCENDRYWIQSDKQ